MIIIRRIYQMQLYAFQYHCPILNRIIISNAIMHICGTIGARLYLNRVRNEIELLFF